MKFNIVPDSIQTYVHNQELNSFSLSKLAEFINSETRTTRCFSFSLEKDRSIQGQIDAIFEDLNYEILFDPAMPNTGGVEVMATLKRDLKNQLELMLDGINFMREQN